MTQSLLSPISALIAHLEPLLADRRILVIANARRSAAEHLLERGARLVQLLDPDARRVAHAAAHNTERRVTYAQLSETSLRDGSYDCVLVEDVELADDLSSLAKGVARSLGQKGVAIFCKRNDEATTGILGTEVGRLDYQSLVDAVETNFEASVMLGQSPFLGYSVVQFGLEAPPEPALDNAYLNGEAEDPDFYIALSGSREALADLRLEDMTIVQLASARFVADNESSERDWGRRATRRIEALEGEIANLRKRSDHAEVERLTRELEQRDAWIRQLESRAESADARADDAQAQVDELELELSELHAVLAATRQDADEAVLERDRALAERDGALLERDEALDAKNVAQAASEQSLRERDGALQEGRVMQAHTEGTGAPHAQPPEVALLEDELLDLSEELEDTKLLLGQKERELEQQQGAFEAETKRVAQTLRQLTDSRAQLKDKSEELESTRKQLAMVRAELSKAQGDANESKHHSAGREAMEQEITLLDEKNRALDATLKEKSQAFSRLERRLAEQEKELDDLHEQLDETEQLLTKVRRELVESTGPTRDELARDVRGLEEQLRERGHRILDLENQLRRLEAYSKTLQLELDRGPVQDDASEELALMARALAEREADLVAAEWKLAQLPQPHRAD